MNRTTVWSALTGFLMVSLAACGGGGGGGGEEPWVYQEPVWTARWYSGIGSAAGYALALQGDGKILVAGHGDVSAQNSTDALLARYDADGTLDASFGTETGGMGTAFWGQNYWDSGNAVALQADGKILVAGTTYNGTNYDAFLLRYGSDGLLDTGFGASGAVIRDIGAYDIAEDVAVQSDGKILICGGCSTNNIFIARYNPDGSADAGFGTGGLATWDGGGQDFSRAMALLDDGKIIVAGSSSNGSDLDLLLLRYNPDGSLDSSFGDGGKVTWDSDFWDYIYDMQVLDGGKILVGGDVYDRDNYTDDALLVRFNPDGSLDTGFGNGGSATWDGGGLDGIDDLAVQPDGRILASGYSHNGSDYDVLLLRFNANGSLDAVFGPGGSVTWDGGLEDEGLALCLGDAGEIYVTGYNHLELILLRMR